MRTLPNGKAIPIRDLLNYHPARDSLGVLLNIQDEQAPIRGTFQYPDEWDAYYDFENHLLDTEFSEDGFWEGEYSEENDEDQWVVHDGSKEEVDLMFEQARGDWFDQGWRQGSSSQALSECEDYP